MTLIVIQREVNGELKQRNVKCTPTKSVTRYTTTGTDANSNSRSFSFDGSGYNSPPIPGGQNQIIRITLQSG